jgi:hypothetical protein
LREAGFGEKIKRESSKMGKPASTGKRSGSLKQRTKRAVSKRRA